MEELEIVSAHHERATLRIGEVFLKVDTDQGRSDFEAMAMALAPIPTPEILWRTPPVLALAALRGKALGSLHKPTTSSPGAWRAAGAVVRKLHDAPLPPWPARLAAPAEARTDLDEECEWLLGEQVLPADVVSGNREIAQAALRPWTPVFTHGDLQLSHVFVDGEEVTGVIDWSDAGWGDALWDLATLTLGHEEHLDDLLAGYGAGADTDSNREVIRGWWSFRCLTSIRWLVEHGFDPNLPGCEADILRAQVRTG